MSAERPQEFWSKGPTEHWGDFDTLEIAVVNNIYGHCHTCKSEIPHWWFREYCADCGNEILLPPEREEILRLRVALREIWDLNLYEYDSMPEKIRKEIQGSTLKIANEALGKTLKDRLQQK